MFDLRYIDTKTGEHLSYKETLRVLHNLQLSKWEREAAHKMGADPAVTEEQAEAELRRLEKLHEDRLWFWRIMQ